MLVKLDAYDYMILPGIIRIRLDCSNDPISVDILSELSRTDNKIYVEGYYYSYLDNYRVYSDNGDSFMELDVVRTA